MFLSYNIVAMVTGMLCANMRVTCDYFIYLNNSFQNAACSLQYTRLAAFMYFVQYAYE